MPDDLNGRQREIYNFQKSAALPADYGFNCIKLTDDWQGAHVLALHAHRTSPVAAPEPKRHHADALHCHVVRSSGPPALTVIPGNNRKPRKSASHRSKRTTLFALKYSPSHSPE